MRKNKLHFLYIIPCIFLLSGCKEDDFTPENLAKLTNKIISYDYNGAWQTFRNALKIANRSRYSENQNILVETARDTQTTTYQNIISECKTLGCTITKNSISKNKVFPENIAGTIELYIPSDSAQTFINNIAKYGTITINNYTSDSQITNDIETLTKKLENLQTIQTQTSGLLAGPDLQNITQITLLQDKLNALNESITTLQSDIQYLQSQIGNRHIKIRIRRGFNSTAGFIKGHLRDTFLFIMDYLHIIIVIALLFSIRYIFKTINNLFTAIKIIIAKHKNKKSHKSEAITGAGAVSATPSTPKETSAPPEFQEPKFTP